MLSDITQGYKEVHKREVIDAIEVGTKDCSQSVQEWLFVSACAGRVL